MKTSADTGHSAESRVEAAAGRWIGLRDGGLTAAQERDFQAWLSADARHAELFAELERTSRALDQLSALRPAGAVRTDPDLRRQLRAGGRAIGATPWRVGVGVLAAAAAIAIGYLGAQANWAPRSYSDAAVTDIGGFRRVNLPDSSTIDLNTNTAVRTQFTAAERRVELVRGEAHFAVARDPSRPFVVQVGAIAVRAIGTAFSVRLERETVEVLVTQGKVGVQEAVGEKSLLPTAESGSPPALEAGYRAVIPAVVQPAPTTPAPVVVVPMTPLEMSRRLAWKGRRLEFGPTPLKDVIAEFNRYEDRPLVIADPELGDLSIGGSFVAGDAGTLVRLLESHFDIEVERRDTETVLRTRR